MSLLLLLACGGPTDAPDVSPPLERAPGERANPHAAPTPSPSGAPPMIAAGDVTHEGAQIWLRAEPAALGGLAVVLTLPVRP